MPVLAISANAALNYSAVTPDTTLLSQSFDDIHINNAAPAYAHAGDTPTTMDLGGGAEGADITSILLTTAAIVANIPAGATINSAILRVYRSAGFGSVMDVSSHSVLPAWVLAEASYNNYSTGNAWNTAGARGATDITTPADATVSMLAGGYNEISVAGGVQDILDGNATGIALHADALSAYAQIGRSTGTDGQRPEIIVNYTAGGGDTTPPTTETGPTLTETRGNGHSFSLDIDEPGTIVGIRMTDGATAPADGAAVLNAVVGGDILEVISVATDGTQAETIAFISASVGTAYDYYFAAEDDEGTPNQQATAAFIGATTHNPGISDTVNDSTDTAWANGTTVKLWVFANEAGLDAGNLLATGSSVTTGGVGQISFADALIGTVGGTCLLVYKAGAEWGIKENVPITDQGV